MEQARQHTHDLPRSKLRLAFVLTGVILLVELAGGALGHSLALFSDAGHVLTDLVALGLAWFAAAQAERPANARKTYGYHRTGILAALANALALIVIVVVIAFEAVQRLRQPSEVTPWIMFVAAAAAIAVNLFIALGLREARGQSLNLRAALLHVTGDIAASAGVIVAGVVIFFTHWYFADPLLSLLIAVLIAFGAWNILRETVEILMEGTPKDLNMSQLVRDIVRQPEITDVHDLHVWSIAGGMLALSAHVQVEDRPLSACDEVLVRLNRLLQEKYGIGHTTIQIECVGCDPNDLYCALNPEGDASHEHAHGDLGMHRHTPQDDELQARA
jgi:cobalt-zinc-cadmium efflux system protein